MQMEGRIMTSLTIAANGQLTLGQEELHHLGLQPGDTLELDHLPNGGLLLKPAAAKKTIKDFIGRHTDKLRHRHAIERFIHTLDGKTYLERPMTIEEMNEIIAAGWAGKLKPE